MIHRLVLGAILTGLLASAGVAQSPSALEKAVKASYLAKFGPFVEWPPNVGLAADAPLTLCVVGEDPFGSLLDEAARGQTVNGRPLAVNRMAAVNSDAALACQIMFIGHPTEQSTAETRQAVAGLPVLTVTDPAHGVSGGMIQFVLQRGRVRFQVDQARASRHGLHISAKLLALAVKVERR